MQTTIYWQLHKLAFLLEKTSDTELKNQLGIGFAQYKVLEAVNQNMLARQNMVAQMLDQTEASISRQVKILQKKGLITITEVMGNRRAKELSLTEIGDEIVSSAEHVLDITLSGTIGSLSFNEQRLLQEMLDKMLQKTKD
jgi:DNA-binding MarR family transcriptional regulator